MPTSANGSRIALITGASRGLGRSMALHLAKQGVDIIGTYKSSANEAQQVAELIRQEGRKAEILQLDASDTKGLPAFIAKVSDALGKTFGGAKVDFLINNAGVGVYTPFSETSEEDFDMLFRLQLKAPYFLTQGMLPHLADGGKILNVSTGLTRFSIPGYSAYACMKGGVEVLTKYLANELGGRGISVNTIAPGAIETDFGGGVVRDNEQMNQYLANDTALGRVGLPDDVGAAVAGLLVDSGSWINAQRIEISGGQHL